MGQRGSEAAPGAGRAQAQACKRLRAAGFLPTGGGCRGITWPEGGAGAWESDPACSAGKGAEGGRSLGQEDVGSDLQGRGQAKAVGWVDGQRKPRPAAALR